MRRVYAVLSEGKSARGVEVSHEEEKLFKELQLITSKPTMYVCNVAEDDAGSGNELSAKVEEHISKSGNHVVVISAKIEEEIASLDDENEKKEFLESIGLHETGLTRVIRAGYQLLDLLTYFTVGPKEARAWTVKKGSFAPEAAGVIHTDFEAGFIRAETISCDDFVACSGESGAKEAGKMRLEGKEYIVQDGDVMHFRFNV